MNEEANLETLLDQTERMRTGFFSMQDHDTTHREPAMLQTSIITGNDGSTHHDLDQYSDIEAWSTPYGLAILSAEPNIAPSLAHEDSRPSIPYAPSPAALALMPKNRRVQQGTTKGLFRWPRECREALYLEIIHPYCGLPRAQWQSDHRNEEICEGPHNHKKITKMLVLCSQVYDEMIEILHLPENIIEVTGDKRRIFRHPKDFGRPGFCQTGVRSTHLEIPPFLSEGQVFRMRKIAIKLAFCDHDRHSPQTETYKRMGLEISDIVTALKNNTSLEQVRVVLNRDLLCRSRWTGDLKHDCVNDQHPPMRHLLRPLINLAHQKGIKIGAEHDSKLVRRFGPGLHDYDDRITWTDPLVTWFNTAAILPENKANFDTLHNRETADMLEKTLGRCKNSSIRYELTPECRLCLKVFANWEELAIHLAKMPKHKMRFRRKKWNELYPFASQMGHRKCPTCAKDYVSVNFLNAHMDEMNHHRSSIVPRYACDNKDYEKRAQQKQRRKE